MGKIKDLIIKNWKTLLVGVLLILLTLSTSYYGHTDIGDYSDAAKYLSGDYSAKTRNSHSYLFGMLHAPFVHLTQSFLSFKITSLTLLFLIIGSVYYISGKNKKAFFLCLFSPIIWYMAPWISPVQISSLLLLWVYAFMKVYDHTEKLKYLFLSGLLLGISGSFWNASLYFGAILMISFLYDKKFYHLLLFCLAILVGMMPLFLINLRFFNFPFISIIKTNLGQFLVTLSGSGIDGKNVAFFNPNDLFFLFLLLPIYFWRLYRPSFIKTEKKSIIFISFSFLIFLANTQIRYILAIGPIMLLLLLSDINKLRLKRYIIVSTIIILFITTPYIIQINYSMSNQLGGEDIKGLTDFKDITLSKNFNSEVLNNDLEKIIATYPNQTFVVGNLPDDYQTLAHYYWGKDVDEFVSIQDYNLYLNNKSTIFQKEFRSSSNINSRRQIWLIGGIDKNPNDPTNYSAITLAIGMDEPINLENFGLISNYSRLYLSEIKNN